MKRLRLMQLGTRTIRRCDTHGRPESGRCTGWVPAVAVAALVAITLTAAPSRASATAAPHDPNLDEFAAVFPLAASGDDGVLQLQLPLAVYQASRTAGLADLRVYNGTGQLLPHALHFPEQRARTEVREQAGTLFPIYADVQAPGNTGSLDLQLRTDANGALVELDVRTNTAQVERDPRAAATVVTRPLAALVVDLGPSAANEVLQALRFQIGDSVRDYHARLAIERSDDLKLWDGVAHGTLDWIPGNDPTVRLVSDRIELPRGSGRYLKLRWLDGAPLAFTTILGEWRGATATPDPRLELTLQPQPGRVDGDFVYVTSPSIAASSIGLDLPEPNTVLPVIIGVYREQRGPKPQWLLAPQISSTFYRLNHDGGERRSSRIQVAPMGSAEWVVRPQSAGSTPPRLVLGWRPQTLVFTARGKDFRLAVGAAPEVVRHWNGGAAALAQVAPGFSATEIAQLRHVQIGKSQRPTAPIAPAAAAAPTDDANAAARRRRFALWAVLAFGLLVLGWMTWRLYSQLGQNAHPED